MYRLNNTDVLVFQENFLALFYRAKLLNYFFTSGLNNLSTIPSEVLREIKKCKRTEPPHYVPPLLQALYSANGGDLTKTMDNVATSVTNQLRNGMNATDVQGTVVLPVAYVHVNLLWLIYPASLSSFAALFLLASIFFSLERGELVWKSSSLPLLFHGLQGWNTDHLDARGPRTMEEMSKKMWAQLSADDSGRLSLRRS